MDKSFKENKNCLHYSEAEISHIMEKIIRIL